MAFQPLTYAGQYPPLTPRSPSDVKSFEMLHASLRQLPELSKEGDKILNEEMLAKLVDGVRRFQRDHLGRKSKSKYWPTLRLPDTIFSDRSSYPSPLGTAILAAFRIKQISPWRNFNFDNPKLFDDNIAIIKRMEGDLIDRGYLKRPVLYFDTTVEEGLGRGEVVRLTKIAQRFGATVVEDPKEVANGRVTHIVAYDPEEHDTKEVIEEEERREKMGEEMERNFLKTLAVVDMVVDEGEMMDDLGENNNGDPNSNNNSNNNVIKKKKMALVHWWYHPSSYDEWISADEVSPDVETEEHPGIPGGPAVVGCKFVRDVEKFNEWGVEADYAVMEYERKIAYLRRKETPKTNVTSTSKKSSKSKRLAAKQAQQQQKSVLETLEYVEPLAKKSKLEDVAATNTIDGAPALSKAPSSPNAPPKKLKSKGSSSTKADTSSASLHLHEPAMRQMSERRSRGSGGMNPRRIAAGVRGVRNEVLRRTVHDGALRVEDEPYRVVKYALSDYALGSTVGLGNAGMVSTNSLKPPTLAAKPEWRKLLPPTGFIRPSVNTNLKYMTVMELTLEEGGPVITAENTEPLVTTKTVAVQRSVPILIVPTVVGVASGGEEPLSMRGGGLDEEVAGDVQPPPQGQEEEHQQLRQGDVPAASSNEPAMNLEVENNEARPAVEAGVGEAVVAEQPPVGMELNPNAEELSDDNPGAATAQPAADSGGNNDAATSNNADVSWNEAPNAEIASEPKADDLEEIAQQPMSTEGDAMQVDEAANPPAETVEASEPVTAAAETAQEEQPVANLEASTEPVEKDLEVVAEEGVAAPPADAGDAPPSAAEGAEKAQSQDAKPMEVDTPATEAEATYAQPPLSDIKPVDVDMTSVDASQPETVTTGAAEEKPEPEATPVVEQAQDQSANDVMDVEVPSEPVAPSTDTVKDVTPSEPAPEGTPVVAEPVAPAAAPVAQAPQSTTSETTAAAPAEVAPTAVAPTAAETITATETPAVMPVAAATTAEVTTAAKTPAAMPVAAATTATTTAPETPAVMPVAAATAATETAATVPVAVTSTETSTSAVPVAGVAPVATATASATPTAPSASAEVQSSTTAQASTTAAVTARPSINTHQQQQPAICKLVPLPAGTPQLSASLHQPSSVPFAEEEAEDDAASKPSWYNHNKPSEFEQRSLPEWFNTSAPHRTPSSYIATREQILNLAKRNSNQYITSTAIRRSVAGDAGSLFRLHKFLMDWGLLNDGQIGETAPSNAVLRGLHAEGGLLARKIKRKYAEVEHSMVWTTEHMQRLEVSVVKHVSKKTDDSGGQAKMVVDWDGVAADIGGGVTAGDCQRAFLEPPSQDAKITADVLNSSNNSSSTFSQIIDGVHPEVLKASIDAALQTTDSISEARKAAFVAAAASAAAQKGAEAEINIERTLMDIVDQRLQRLENRVALLDDVEALLEAERVALELERRDMYTARCRHWFGDGSS